MSNERYEVRETETFSDDRGREVRRSSRKTGIMSWPTQNLIGLIVAVVIIILVIIIIVWIVRAGAQAADASVDSGNIFGVIFGIIVIIVVIVIIVWLVRMSERAVYRLT